MSKKKDPATNREKAIASALSAIQKQFGQGAIMRLGSDENLHGDVPVIPSGASALISRSVLEAIHAVGSSRFTDQKPAVRLRSLCTRSLRHRN